MSGRSSRSTFTAMNLLLMTSASSALSYDSRSITWHQWHHTAPISSRIGLFSRLAAANASSPHWYHRIGWCMADLRYEDDACANAFRFSVDISALESLCE